MLNYHYDAEEILINDEIIVVAADNSGSIGMKELDDVKVGYETVSYYTFRVAYMECIAAGGDPFAIVLHSFNDEDVWHQLIKGINKGLKEVNLENIPITGSTETNFKLNQSALGLVVLGKKKWEKKSKVIPKKLELAIIGKPLVGQAVIDEQDKVAPLSLYKELSEISGVNLIYPISSKGIKHAIDRQVNQLITYPNHLDITASSGPGTSFLIVYDTKISQLIKQKTTDYLQMVHTLS